MPNSRLRSVLTFLFKPLFQIFQVPTIAIEHVWIAVNTSIIQDEVLAHRVGLIPIKADARKLEYVIADEETDKDTIVFHFDVECTTVNVGGEVRVVNDSALSGELNGCHRGLSWTFSQV